MKSSRRPEGSTHECNWVVSTFQAFLGDRETQTGAFDPGRGRFGHTGPESQCFMSLWFTLTKLFTEVPDNSRIRPIAMSVSAFFIDQSIQLQELLSDPRRVKSFPILSPCCDQLVSIIRIRYHTLKPRTD